jgi:hypothetical protein
MEIKMTTEAFLAEFGGTKVSFISYYKFRFTYGAIIGDKRIVVELGDADGDIYRSEFSLVETINPSELLYYTVIAL